MIFPRFLPLFLFARFAPELLSLLLHLLTGEFTALLGFALSLSDILRKCSLEILCLIGRKENMMLTGTSKKLYTYSK